MKGDVLAPLLLQQPLAQLSLELVGAEFVFGKPDTWGRPHAVTITESTRYGTARATAWDRLHPRLTRRCAWVGHTDELPMISGTVIRLQVDHLPKGGDPKPVWLWWSKTDAAPCGAAVERAVLVDLAAGRVSSR